MVNRLGQKHSGIGRGRKKLYGRRTDLNNTRHQATVESRNIDMRNRSKGRIRNGRLEVNAGRQWRTVLVVGSHVDLRWWLRLKSDVGNTWCMWRKKRTTGGVEQSRRVKVRLRVSELLWEVSVGSTKWLRLAETRQVDTQGWVRRCVPLQIAARRCWANLRTDRLGWLVVLNCKGALLLGFRSGIGGFALAAEMHLTGWIRGFEPTRCFGRFVVVGACRWKPCHA